MGDKRGPPGIHKADPKRQKYGVSVSEILADALTPLANAYWAVGSKSAKAYEPAIIEDIYNTELANKPLINDRVQLLEISGYLENYLWKNFDDVKSSFAHVMSIIILVNEKFRQNLLDVWKTFESRQEMFVPFIQRVWSLKMGRTLSMSEHYSYLLFVIHAFQSLENPTVRSACLRLTSPVLWQTLTPSTLKKQVKLFPGYRRFLKKVQKSSMKNKDAGELEKSFLPDLISGFFAILKTITPASLAAKPAQITLSIHYCERFLELMIDLMAQLPTRRFFHAVLADTKFAVLCELSDLNRKMKEGKLFTHMFDMLKNYLHFEIDDQSGSALTDDTMMSLHYEKFQFFQTVVFKHFKKELSDVATSSVQNIETRKALTSHLKSLNTETLRALCERMELLEPQKEGVTEHLNSEILMEMLIYHLEKRKSRKQEVRELPLYPTEQILWDEDFVPSQNYVGDGCLALPKLNLQFLTLHDYLLRNFNLYRLESTYEIRGDIADTIFKLKPRLSANQMETVFTGYARMAIPIYAFAITQVRKAKIGESKPSLVKGDITVDLTPFGSTAVRQEWEELREHDVLFLMTIEAKPEMSDKKWNQNDAGFDWEQVNRDSLGIVTVRGAEILRVLDEDKKVIGEMDEHGNRHIARGNVRTYQVELDAAQYQQDMEEQLNKENIRDPYTTFNLLLRRKAKENNFRAVLATIRDLMYEECRMPNWLHDVFLGYGAPEAAQYHNIPKQLTDCAFRDTFQDHKHIQDSFPEAVKFESEEGKEWTPAGTFYKIEFVPGQKPNHAEIQTLLPFSERQASPAVVHVAPKAPEEKKRRRKADQAAEEASELKERVITVTPYSRPKVWGEKIIKRNLVRFTPMQAEAIKSGLMKGLTQIVGPPGTGKTDTAVQIISELYHNFPDQRILLVTHSNHALNDLFEKIMERDIDERYLLRLGRGQDFLQSDKDFSKFGRVNHMLQRRLGLLDEVTSLAASMDIKDDVGSTCETAHHFFNYHVLASWEQFQKTVKNPEECKGKPFSKLFPFTLFFEGLQEGELLFDDSDEKLEENMEIAHSCWRYLKMRFTELDETKPFERMRTGKDRGTYLLTKHAKVIAMTCTHAAINRSTLIKSGFQFDNIIMEEAAQILEIETFIPMMLQVDDKEFGNRLQRVILLGDHYQLPPVIKNPAFQKFCHMDQSMFTRFVRLGMPYIQLNAQGRMRPELADLWNWKYDNLNNLPNVTSPRYLKANAGMRHVVQLIDVQDGQGESSPSAFFYQNLAEAEYVCATYQYMRLLGYPASKISIITSYNGQKSLLRDVFAAKCHNDPLYGDPAKITTVDKFQGQQNDYILLSLVRTKVAGHIRDIRRLVVAMSRARLGLYVFCRKELYLNCFELTRTFNVLLKSPTELEIYPKEVTEEFDLQGLAPNRLAADKSPEPVKVADVTEMVKIVAGMKAELKAAFEQYTKRIAEAEARRAAEEKLLREREARAKEARSKQKMEDHKIQRAAEKQAEYAAQTEVFMDVASKKMDEAEDAETAQNAAEDDDA